MSNSKVIAGGIPATGGAGEVVVTHVADSVVWDGVVYDEEQWRHMQVLQRLDRIASLLERLSDANSG